MNEREWLEQYAKTGSEEAFGRLVRGHIDWVHSREWTGGGSGCWCFSWRPGGC